MPTSHEARIVAASWLLSPHADPLPGGALVIQQGRIMASGTLSELKRSYSLPVVEYPGHALLPGFINTHTHLELTHFPSWRLRCQMDYHPRRFVDWIIQMIKVKGGLTAEDYQASLREGMRICLESGTTAVGDIVSLPALANAWNSAQLSGRRYFEVLGHDRTRFDSMLTHAVAAAQSVTAGGLSPHSAYTIGEGNLPLITAQASSCNLPLSLHLSESTAETDFIFDSSGPLAEVLYPFVSWQQYLTPPRRCSSTELLDRAGLLSPATLAVHCVHVSRSDAELLKQRGVHVALCPRSNERLDVGRAPLALLKKLHIPLSLGTDSLASNDSLSLWDELRFSLDQFPHDLTPRDVFTMVTSNAAAALGIEASHGSLEVGKRADFQFVSGVEGASASNIVERIVCDGRVADVFVAGVPYGQEA